MASFPALPSGNNPYASAALGFASAAAGTNQAQQKKKRGDGWDVMQSVPLQTPMPTAMEAES